MSAPGKRVAGHSRRVCKLYEEQLLRRKRGDGGKIVGERQCVKAVDDQAERAMIRLAHSAQILRPSANVTPPRERLVTDAQAAARGALRHLVEVARGSCGVIESRWMDVAAHEHEVSAEGFHHIELPFGAIKIAAALRLGHRLEVTKRLKDCDGELEVLGKTPHLLRLSVEGQEIVLEYFHAREAGRSRGFHFVEKRARKANGRDRPKMPARTLGSLHRPLLSAGPTATGSDPESELAK